jgi:ABC-type glycerol-3-phosphate transport system permease component
VVTGLSQPERRGYSSLTLFLDLATFLVTVVGLVQGLDKKVLDRNYRTVTMALVAFQGNAESYTAPDFGALMAAYALASVPLLILFSFLMRSYIEGLSSGSLKG